MARIVPTIPLQFLRPWRSDVGGTSPWMGEGTSPRKDEVELCLEQRPRTMHDCRDAGGRATQETKPMSNCRELRLEHDSREGGVRVKQEARTE